MKWLLRAGLRLDPEYMECVAELLENSDIASMREYIQHSDVSCLEHCLTVSFNSYLVCKRLGLDYRSAARGGLLHDFFMYDWHGEKPYIGLHGFIHPYISLENAGNRFELNDMEKDIIVKHMFPLTPRLPRYLESFVVVAVDKYCALLEIARWFRSVPEPG